MALSSKSRWRRPDLELSTFARSAAGTQPPQRTRFEAPEFTFVQLRSLPRKRPAPGAEPPTLFLAPGGGKGTDHEGKRWRITLCDGYHPKYRPPRGPLCDATGGTCGAGLLPGHRHCAPGPWPTLQLYSPCFSDASALEGLAGVQKGGHIRWPCQRPPWKSRPLTWLGSERQHPVISEVWEGARG